MGAPRPEPCKGGLYKPALDENKHRRKATGDWSPVHTETETGSFKAPSPVGETAGAKS